MNAPDVSTHVKGQAGEKMAELYLVSVGMSIIERNFRHEGGEIDLIALDGSEIVFVEVKSWAHYSIENLEFAINEKKQRKIIETSKFFMQKYRKYSDMTIRFDVIFITQDAAPIHLESAFSESV